MCAGVRVCGSASVCAVLMRHDAVQSTMEVVESTEAADVAADVAAGVAAGVAADVETRKSPLRAVPSGASPPRSKQPVIRSLNFSGSRRASHSHGDVDVDEALSSIRSSSRSALNGRAAAHDSATKPKSGAGKRPKAMSSLLEHISLSPWDEDATIQQLLSASRPASSSVRPLSSSGASRGLSSRVAATAASSTPRSVVSSSHGSSRGPSPARPRSAHSKSTTKKTVARRK